MNENASCPSLGGCSIVACGTLRREIGYLADKGFLDNQRIFFTAPGLHEWPEKLEKQLARQAKKARAVSEKVIVVFGEKCYLDFDAGVDTDAFLAELGKNFARVRATNCVDMLADAEARDRIASGSKIYWLTTGWLEYWDY